jgi:tRNA A-37 threonylcarbamoyl transferase component Bud32
VPDEVAPGDRIDDNRPFHASSLVIGTTLGPYRIVDRLGAGGMGEVYRGRDATLNRDVAIKVLPASMASDADRLARFRREAQVLASLNHPNIAHVYGFECAPLADGSSANLLAMELVEGEDLAERLRRGAIPVDEGLTIARQIADGLAEAHERGVVHRDLKPANVKVTPDGRVKILDFGLAKAFAGEPADSIALSQLAHSPTFTRQMTEAGLILGTAAYMSPEQARGKTVDRRADIWAFGVVLYEMLSGTRLFAGDTVSDTLAEVLKTDPDWTRLPAETPPAVRRLLRRCLERDAKKRLGWIGDVGHDLDDPPAAIEPVSSAGSPVAAGPWRRALPLAGAVLLGAGSLALVASFAGWGGAPDRPAPVSRLTIESAAPPDDVAISPDGTRILLRRGRTLELRSMSDFEAVAVKMADVAVFDEVIFSPDAQTIAFSVGVMLKRIPATGGAAMDVARLPGDPEGCSWSAEYIYCGLGAGGIVRVAASGGAVEQVITLPAGEHAATPRLLPGGDALLFTLAPGVQRPNWQRSSIVVQSLTSGRREVVAASGSDARYLPTGHVAYVVEGVLFAVGFDTVNNRPAGTPVAIVQGVGRRTRGGVLQPQSNADVAGNGTLVYLPGSVTRSADKQIVITERTGKERVLTLGPDLYESPRVSPDGRQLALSTNGPQEAAVLIYDLSETHAIRRLTFAGRSRLPVWSPDGRRLAFQSDRDGDTAIHVQAADGSGDVERLTKADAGVVHIPESWSRDGRYLSFSVVAASGVELWLRSMDDGSVARFGDVRSNAPMNSAFSPDGQWIAYTERGRSGNTPTAVFVQPVPATGARYQVSTDNDAGHHPFWAPGGKELFHWSIGGSVLVSTSMTLSGSVTAGRPVRVPGEHPSNTSALGPLNYDITPDARAFVSARSISDAAAAGAGSGRGAVRVVLNWHEELKQRVPVK